MGSGLLWSLAIGGSIWLPVTVLWLVHRQRRCPAPVVPFAPVEPAVTPAGAVSRWCEGQAVFLHLTRALLALDAVIDECDEPDVPRGAPIALLLRIPPAARPMAESVRSALEADAAVRIELHGTGRIEVRLSTAAADVVLPLQHAAGWPSKERRAEAA
jgi:hypothetical protein